jgi:hypothetical protein
MKKDRWVWMPHPAHFICARDCKFHLATYVGGYVVSTVGELWPDSKVREIHAQVKGVKIEGKGDEWDYNYMKRFGFDDIGCARKYETMVFKAKRYAEGGCCPWRISSGSNVDFEGYNDPDDAYAGHLKLCAKWAKKAASAG